MTYRLNKEFRTLKNEYISLLKEQRPIKGLKNVEAFKNKVFYALDKVEVEVVDNNKEAFKIEYGNKKLPRSTLIASTGTWYNCLGRKEGFCEICNFCYARSPEIMFKDILASRIKKELIFRAFSSEKIANDIISQVKKGSKAIRFNEVGEMRHNKDLKKMIEISNIVYTEKGLKSYVYTHNKALKFDVEHNNLTINGSNFYKKGINNTYLVLNNEKEAPKGSKRCICNCKGCNLCLKDVGTLYEILRK